MEEQDDLRTGVGRSAFGVECRIVEPETTDPSPHDGTTSGELQCRGNWIARTYYDDPRADDSFTEDGWLRTGDVATMDARGRMRLVDRTKDLIKSGGEWISSVELENELMAHPKIREAAVIGIPDDKWSERPLACVVLEQDVTMTAEEVREFLAPRSPSGRCPTTSCSSTRCRRRASGSSRKRTSGRGTRREHWCEWAAGTDRAGASR